MKPQSKQGTLMFGFIEQIYSSTMNICFFCVLFISTLVADKCKRYLMSDADFCRKLNFYSTEKENTF